MEGVYKTRRRQLYRWHSMGAPLFHPEEMPEWWAKVCTIATPKKIIAAAEAAQAARSASDPGSPPSSSGDSPSPGGAVNVKSEESIALSDFQLGEGAEVEFQRRIVAAEAARVERAYAAGAGVEGAQKRYNTAVEALRKLNAGAREARKQSGDLIPRGALKSDAFTIVKLLRDMREKMPRRVGELVPELTGELRERVMSAIKLVREQEDALFLNFKPLRGHVPDGNIS